MDKKIYIKPRTDIFEFRSSVQLLQMSGEVPWGDDWLGYGTPACPTGIGLTDISKST